MSATRILFAVLFLFWNVVEGDPCQFGAWSSTSYPWTVTSREDILSCFDAIPLDHDMKAQTLTQVNHLVELYSFTDISANSGAPYNMMVDLQGGLSDIANAWYPNDFAFHHALYNLFLPLGDAHTLYSAPAPYMHIQIIRPFLLSSSFEDGEQVVRVANTVALFGEVPFGQVTGVDATPYKGMKILSVNGVPILDYLCSIGSRRIISKDEGARFNNILNHFTIETVHEGDILNNDGVETYVFEGGQSVTITPIYFVSRLFTGVSDFLSTYAYNPQKRSVADKAEDPLHRRHYFQILDEIIPADPNREQMRVLKTLTGISTSSRHKRSTDTGSFITVSETSDSSASCLIYNGSLGEIPVLILASFSPAATVTDTTAWYQSYIAVIESCKGFDNLIVDVRSNGGGLVCLALSSALALVGDEWDPNTNNMLFSAFDYRKSMSSDILFNGNYDVNSANAYSFPGNIPATNFNDNSWYSPSVDYERGDINGNYTPKFYFPSAECTLLTDGLNHDSPISQIILLSDGLCGSACSQFISKLRYHGKAAIVTQGGIVGKPLESSSFTGGNVIDWAPYLKGMNAEIGTYLADFNQLPTSAAMRYNFREFYLGNEDFPREFMRIEGDARLSDWSPPYSLAKDLTQLENTISMVAEFFDGTITWPVNSMGDFYQAQLS